MKIAISLTLFAALAQCCSAFAPPSTTTTRTTVRTTNVRPATKSTATVTQLASFNPSGPGNNNGQFDITKPQFDIYTLRGVRGDALAKYSSLNQSEPLRINLSLLAAFLSASYPFLSQDVSADIMGTVPTAACGLAAVAFGGNFARECRRRNQKLTRLEKELQALQLPLRLPSSNVFSDSLYDTTIQSVRQVQQKRTLRVLALYGDKEQLTKALLELAPLGQRLVQSETVVVPVPSDGSTLSDWGLGKTQIRGTGAWLAAPGNAQEWSEYFVDSLSTTTTSSDGTESATTISSPLSTFKWFGLSATGRSFGSGQGELPSWLQLMGQHLRPTALLDEDDANQDDASGVLDSLNTFYQALTNGDLESMQKSVFADTESPQVSSIMEQGGRLDNWAECLKEDNRPAGMKVANADVFVVNEHRAYSTVIEFPAFGMVPGDVTPTLLAVQCWVRGDSQQPWRLTQHQTIPWSDSVPAGGTLVADKRGCVSLVRTR